MARPKRRRGYSPIVVEGRRLAWRVSIDFALHIQGDTNGGCRLCVEYGGRDPWLEPSTAFHAIPVKPKFVAESSKYALAHGWNPDAHASQFNLVWKSGSFYVASNPAIEVRRESAGDAAAIRAVDSAAFETPAEADLVDRLREAAVAPFDSYVAVNGKEVVGHILITPVDVVGPTTSWDAQAIGPMSVMPEWQKRGIGSQLVHWALMHRSVIDVVFVLGHPEYYPRFGFRRMSEFGITCEFKAPDDVLMVAELTPGAIAGRTGEVRYHPLFQNV